ncbi:pseudaminic acid synthase [Prochlorococcus sp. AH-736-P13]|nr:pseudaminic acid synthase [Prochlorococcus sp. AH-736-P13]MDA9693752.1 pseudaminic acid synthase [Prochlorococcus sp. AH-736-P13]
MSNNNSYIEIDGKKIGASYPPYIIAEISANHNGSLERALNCIKSAADCGVDAVKIQTYSAETMTIDCDNEDFMIKGGLWNGFKLFDLYKWAETPFEWHNRMFEYARSIGITLFSTPFDETAVDLLESLNTPAYKVASFELVDLPLIEYIAKKKKPIIMSTGMASENEISEAVQTVLSTGNKKLSLLHCISSYPAPPEKSNLKQIVYLSKKFNLITGLSDHTLGTTTAVASIPLGSSIIEKHFTLNRKEKGPDSEFSLEPIELKELCSQAKQAWLSLGSEEFKRQKVEDQSKLHRRSIYYVNNIKSGSTITNKDIRRIRPGKGLPPKYFNEIVGKELKVNVNKGDATKWSDFKN